MRHVFAGLVVTLVALFGNSHLHAAKSFAYISLSGESRIATFAVNPADGSLTHSSDVSVDGMPGPLTCDPTRQTLFASIRETGWLASFRIDAATGKLTFIGRVKVQSNAAYLSVDQTGRWLLSADYTAGKVAVHPIRRDGSLDGDQAVWQTTAPKAHAIVFDPAEEFAFVPHTAPEAIFQFRWNAEQGQLAANDPDRVNTPAGDGPRHLVFHPQLPVAYVSNEQGGSVTAWRLDRDHGTLTSAQTLSTLPADFRERNACSHLEITPDGRFVYVANRGHDSLACFRVDSQTGLLRAAGQTPVEPTPRSFNIDPRGRFLYVAGQGSGKLAAFRVDDENGQLNRFATYDVGAAPWWVFVVNSPVTN